MTEWLLLFMLLHKFSFFFSISALAYSHNYLSRLNSRDAFSVKTCLEIPGGLVLLLSSFCVPAPSLESQHSPHAPLPTSLDDRESTDLALVSRGINSCSSNASSVSDGVLLY